MSIGQEPVRFIDFHRSPHRRAHFDGERQGIFFDAALHRWIVQNVGLATDVLADPRFVTADYEGICAHMAATGQPVANLAFAYAHIPLCHDGQRHRALRRSMSEHLAARRKENSPHLRALVAKYLRRLNRPGTVELMAELLAPMVDEFMSRIVDVVIDDARALAALSPAFDHLMGARKLLHADGEIAKVRRAIELALAADEPEAAGRHLALLMLGRDPLLGTLGESLRHVFEKESGTPTGKADFPLTPPETGVPYVERLAREDCAIAGVEIARGDRLRILLQAYCYSDAEREHLRIFGTGSHACLGRPLALDMWRELTSQLRELNIRVVYKGSAPRTTDYVFTCPEFVNVEVLS